MNEIDKLINVKLKSLKLEIDNNIFDAARKGYGSTEIFLNNREKELLDTFDDTYNDLIQRELLPELSGFPDEDLGYILKISWNNEAKEVIEKIKKDKYLFKSGIVYIKFLGLEINRNKLKTIQSLTYLGIILGFTGILIVIIYLLFK